MILDCQLLLINHWMTIVIEWTETDREHSGEHCVSSICSALQWKSIRSQSESEERKANGIIGRNREGRARRERSFAAKWVKVHETAYHFPNRNTA